MKNKDKDLQTEDKHLARSHNAPVRAQRNASDTSILTPTKEQVQRINTYSINGNELGRILKAYGMHQKDFADKIGVHQVTVSRWCIERKKIWYSYTLQLVEMVGEDFFITTVAKIRGK